MKTSSSAISLLVVVVLVFGGHPAPAAGAAAAEPATRVHQADAGKNNPTPAAQAKKSFDTPPAIGARAICPVTGSEFTVTKDTQRSEYQGRHYVFCCPECKPQFDANPKKYI